MFLVSTPEHESLRQQARALATSAIEVINERLGVPDIGVWLLVFNET